jgi:HEAT repeat protein
MIRRTVMRVAVFRHIISLICIAMLSSTAACSNPPSGGGAHQAPPLPNRIDALIDILGQKNAPNRNAAIQALAARGDEAVNPLVDAMAKGEDTRQGAISALVAIGKPALPALNQALTSQDWQIRYGAILAIGEMGPDAAESVGSLLNVFAGNRNPDEQIAIIHSLGRTGPGNAEAMGLLASCLLVDSLRNYALRAFGEMGASASPAVPRILSILEDQDTQARFEAISALEGIGPFEGVVDGIAGRLKDGEARVRLEAAKALGEFGPDAAGATSALADALGDSEADVRQAAAKALGDIAPASAAAIPKLIRALGDSEPQTRREVANALGRFGSHASSSVSALQRIADSDEFDYVRNAARQAIQAIQTPPGSQQTSSGDSAG